MIAGCTKEDSSFQRGEFLDTILSLPPHPPNSGCTKDDLSFQRGELMVVIDDADGDWWYAKHVKTNQEGYVPSNYVAPVRTMIKIIHT